MVRQLFRDSLFTSEYHHCGLCGIYGLVVDRPASRCGTEMWPDLRQKWPQVDRRRLDHIRLDLTWLESGMWLESTSNDFRTL